MLALGTAMPTLATVQPLSPPEILQQLKSFNEFGSVLYVAAHPDDENTLLIGFLARGRNYRTAYLSVTRGDGGQNVLGPEFGDELGVARTQELLAARRVDGGQQFFTRAVDFGFSKDYQETLRIWDHKAVVGDIVRVIRTFRPDVIVTRFPPHPSNTHGHHTASAVLALEAFRLAGQPSAYPEQLDTLRPWQPTRILWNSMGREDSATNTVQMEIKGYDPVTGLSFGELAGRSRSMHKTQGFGNYTGGGRNSSQSFELLDGEPAEKDIMDGVDTTWGRIPGATNITAMTMGIITNFNMKAPGDSVVDLVALHHALVALKSKDPIVWEKRAQLDRILQSCLGLTISTTVTQAEVVPGETIHLHHTVTEKSDSVMRWLNIRFPSLQEVYPHLASLVQDETNSCDESITLPRDTPISQPYWLREEGTPGMFVVNDPELIGQPENPPVFPVEFSFMVGGEILTIPDEPILAGTDSKPEHVRRLQAIPPVYLHFTTPVELFKPGETKSVEVVVTANRPDIVGTLSLLPSTLLADHWTADPSGEPFAIAEAGGKSTVRFNLTAPAKGAIGRLAAVATVAGMKYSNDRVEINYPHIPFQLLQPAAILKTASMDLETRGHKIGYLPGAGDSVAEDLRLMGYAVTTLTDADLTPEKLHDFDAVVIGVRAFNVRTNLGPQLPALFDYVKSGGTVVAQYNRPEGLKATPLAPYDLKIANLRVTDENAEMTFLAPDHPALNTPNKITAKDFEGWVQERGIYFPSEWDAHFTPLLACHDPGEEPLKGSLLVAKYGNGYFVYTGLDFFRELPAGVPGAYRLFANLISLGK